MVTEHYPVSLRDEETKKKRVGSIDWARHETRLLTFILLLVSGLYIAVSTYLNHFGTFWSPDSDIRFVMLRSWASGGSPIFLPYAGHDLDPTYTINPLGHVFAITLGKELCGVYNPVFVFACGVFYKLFGFGGLTVIPLAAGLAAVYFTYASARLLNLKYRLLLTLLLSVGTPLIIYSNIFWDHSLQILLASLAVYFSLRLIQEKRPVFGAAAGATLGFGVWIHPLLGILFAAMGLSLFLVYRKNLRSLLPVIPATLAGFLPFVIAFLLWNHATYGSFGGAHAIGTLRNTSPDVQVSLSDPMKLLQRAQLELLGLAEHSPALVLVCACLSFYILSLFTGSRLRQWTAPLFCFGAATVLWKAIPEGPWANGLFQGTALLLPALASPFLKPQKPKLGDANTPEKHLCLLWMALTFLFFAPGVFLSPGFIGLNWGSRFLLTCLPLLALLSAHVFEVLFSEARGLAKWLTGFLFCGLVFMSVSSQVQGLRFVTEVMQGYQNMDNAIESAASPIFVTNLWQVSLQTETAKRPTERFLVTGKPEDQAAFVDYLSRSGAHEFTFIGSEKGAQRLTQSVKAVSPAPFVPEKATPFFQYIQVRYVQKP